VGFEPHVVYRSAREDWVQTMVAAGLGIAVMPEFTHTDLTTVARPLVDPELFQELSLVTVAGRQHTPAVNALLRTVRSHRWDGDGARGDGGSDRKASRGVGPHLILSRSTNGVATAPSMGRPADQHAITSRR
jgi:hypothetical protein